MKVASQMQHSGTLGGASVSLPLNRLEHHRSKSIASSSLTPSKQHCDTGSWRYRTISPANPLSRFYNGKPQFERMTPQRASQGSFLDASRSVPTRPRLDVSPFSRSRSRVFYASEDSWTNVNNANMAKGPEASFEVPSKDLEPFRRSVHHRTSSGRKSCDSGFSDSGDAISSSGKSKQGSIERSPPRKVQKWASSSPIKAFLKSHEISTTHGLPKLSMLKCCVGIGPGFPFYCRQKKIQGSEVPKTPPRESCQLNFDGGTVVDTRSKDCKGPLTPVPPRKAEHMEKAEGMGTWPRIRKNKKPELIEGPASGHGKNAYHSTRIRNHLQFHGKDSSGSLNRQKGSAVNISDKRIMASIHNSSLHQWSKDLQWTTEDECMNTLQSKTVVRDVADVIAMTNRNAKDTILAVRAKCEAISIDFAKLKRKMDKHNFRRTESICDRISSSIESLLQNCKFHQGQETSIQQYHRLATAHLGIVLHLLDCARCGELNEESLHSLHGALFALMSTISSLTEALIQIHIKSIVDVLEEAPSLYSLKIAIATIEELAIQDVHLCQNISASGGIHVLLTVCVDPRYKTVRARAIRAIAMLCCVSESIREMEECGGVECITDILAEKASSEEEKREAAGFIAQVTSPTLDNHHVEGLSENIPRLIRSLTELAKVTKSCDSFLLATAAIGNLTFLSNHACLHLHHSKTVGTLVSICQKTDSRSESVFVKDQVATILANMSSLPEGRMDVIDCDGLTVLLCFLQIRPYMVNSKAEISACERVQQKSAIALSRLCSNVSVAKQVITLQGVHRLVRLCKDERERNQSDAVLVACLAVLRKIATACGFEEFKDLDAMELVEPRLLDTFLIYSSRQESYV